MVIVLIPQQVSDFLSSLDGKSERVALLTGVRSSNVYAVRYAIEVPNRHARPKEHFLVKTADVPNDIELSDIVGCAHTHPQGDVTPSPDDLAQLPPTWLGATLYGPERGWYRRGRIERASVHVVQP